MNIGFLVTARLKSERLPLKILKSIKGKPLLSHMINRIKLSKYVNKIIVCTSKKRQDDKIEKLCKDEKINCYRGHAEDVLLRLYEASKKFNLDYIVNITADCPLVEPYYIDQICKTYKKKKFDLIRAFDLPHGSFSYGIKIPALKKIINIKSTSNTAAWEKYFTDTGLFKIHDLKIKNKLHIKPGLRMTLDYPEDLEFLKKIFNALYDKNKNFDLTNIIKLLDKEPDLLKINMKCVNKWKKKYNQESKIKILRTIKIKRNIRKYKKFSEYLFNYNV